MDSKQTSLKLLADQNYDAMMMQQMIRVTDAASMLRRKVSNNERPYEKEIISKNNSLVDEWYQNVLLKIADKTGHIQAGRVSSCFEYFIQGKEIAQYQKCKRFLPSYPEEMVRFWINAFKELSPSELHDLGTANVAAGWYILTTAIRVASAERKWEVVYSKSTDPYEWDKMANDNPHVMNGRPTPFGLTLEVLKEMEEKIIPLLKIKIEPK